MWFVYRKVIFAFDEHHQTFGRLTYPTRLPLRHYLTATGHTTALTLRAADARWGRNAFDLPLPLFLELFKEHAVAPFFVFQMFSVCLWCLDEYIYYSLLTGVMLVFFEGMMVKQRQKNFQLLRRMLRPPQPCLCYRGKQWIDMSSEALVPGDIISVKRSSHLTDGHDDNTQLAPCDALLLSGECVVNEAMLSGESIPLRKESISGQGLEEDGVETLHIDAGNDGTTTTSSMIHKKHVIFSGTKILQHTPTTISSLIPKCPDGGCPAFVLRTGMVLF